MGKELLGSPTFNGSHLLQSCLQLLILIRNMQL